LAGAGLRAADDVLARQNQRNRPKLNRCRFDVPHRLHALDHRLGKAKFAECHITRKLTARRRKERLNLWFEEGTSRHQTDRERYAAPAVKTVNQPTPPKVPRASGSPRQRRVRLARCPALPCAVPLAETL